MSMLHRNYNSRERLSERICELEERIEKVEVRFQALSDLLCVAYKDGRFAIVEAFHIVPNKVKK
jgi:hypothetical protein